MSNNWISILGKEPELNKEVLVAISNGSITIAVKVQLDKPDSQTWRIWGVS